ncbi:MAG TPA: hypothetical protein VN903_15130 [Polyangia bacterium]|nr:hypothetical protein [Polyangia bacterium]
MARRDLDFPPQPFGAGEGTALEHAAHAVDLQLQSREGGPQLVGRDGEKLFAKPDGRAKRRLGLLLLGDVGAAADHSGEVARRREPRHAVGL